jgi:nucleoside-diphosphate-sugar epimerase
VIADSRVLVTGATGQVGTRIARFMNESNEVFGAARFRDADARAGLEEAGITTVPFKLGDAELGHLPDVDYVVHCAANTMPKNVDVSFRTNADGTGFLMQRYAGAQGFFHMSSASVYRGNGARAPLTEDADLGGFSRYSPHYAMSKLVSEAVVRFQSRALGLPTVIARLEVAYGAHGHGGVPNILVMMLRDGTTYQRAERGDSPTVPIHENDIAHHVSALLEHASTPALVVNLGGDEVTTVEEIVSHIEDLTGREMPKESSPDASYGTKSLDATRRLGLVGPCTVHWRDGVRDLLETRHPDLLS